MQFADVLEGMYMDEKECLFCNFDKRRVLEESDYSFAAFFCCAIRKGHIVIALKSHVTSLSKLDEAQAGDLMKLAARVAARAEKLVGNEKYYLVSIADETPHYHLHLLPKMEGDPPFGRHIMGDDGWKGEVGQSLSTADIDEFISRYRETG
jgi:diadenosine tetraphosphate (Ap4A) HIT family hydrolase